MSTRGAVHLAESAQWLAWQRDANALHEPDADTLRRAKPWQRNEGSLLHLAAKLAAAWNARIRISLTNADRRQLAVISWTPRMLAFLLPAMYAALIAQQTAICAGLFLDLAQLCATRCHVAAYGCILSHEQASTA